VSVGEEKKKESLQLVEMALLTMVSVLAAMEERLIALM